MDPATEMSPQEVEALREFKERIADVMPAIKNDFFRLDLSLLRFLRARELNLNKSEAMLRNHLSWRAANKVDDILEEKVPLHFFEDFPVKIAGRDKEGYIVATAQVGKWDFRSMVESGMKDEFIRFVVQWIERGAYLCDQVSTENKFHSQVCLILDFEGFEYRQLASKAFITMLLEIIKIVEDNYPEVLRAIWAINTPAVFNILWGIIKPFMTERTTSKIRIFGSNKNKWRADILTMIDEDNVPSLFSGANTSCPDYQFETDFDIKRLSPKFKVFPVEDMKKTHVRAGQVFTVEVNACYGTEINWNFLTDKHDINFRVEFEDEEDIIKPCRVDSSLCTQKGKIFCEKRGLYTLVFDNTYSSYTGKTLRYIVSTS